MSSFNAPTLNWSYASTLRKNMMLFIVSNVQHLVFAQILRAQFKCRAGLLLWTLRGAEDTRNAMESILLTGLWTRISTIEPKVVSDFHPDILFGKDRKEGVFKGRRKIKAAQTEIANLIAGFGDLGGICISNSTGVIDRYVWSLAKCKGLTVYYVEDGLKAYMSGVQSVKVRKGARQLLYSLYRCTLMAGSGINRFAIKYTDTIFDFDTVPDFAYLVYPERAPAELRSCAMSLPLSNSLQILDAMRMKAVGGRTFPKCGVLYISRADSEDGYINLEDEIIEVSRILSDLHSITSGIVYLKPHPRDRKQKLEAILNKAPNCRLLELDTPLPIEVLAPALGIEVCVGTWTGSLLYLKALYGIQTFALLPLLLERLVARGRSAPKLEIVRRQMTISFPAETNWIDEKRLSKFKAIRSFEKGRG